MRFYNRQHRHYCGIDLHVKGKALSILAHKIGRAVYYMLARGTVFSMEKFLHA